MRVIAINFFILSAALLAGCSAENKLLDRTERFGGLWGVSITSTAFENGQAIPKKYTQYGQNVSPPLKWSKGPKQLKEWLLIVEDADKKVDNKGRPAVHWLVYKIPADVTELPEGAAGNGLPYPQGKNYLNRQSYDGPKPPPDAESHRYYFQIFALDTEQKYTPGMDRAQIIRNFKGHVLTSGELVGLYPAPKQSDE
jgi:Raf kinase inhibitor-like YbhB/YbcL family protein